jgi:glycosyltransferase involved in cell wall biosynthesis
MATLQAGGRTRNESVGESLGEPRRNRDHGHARWPGPRSELSFGTADAPLGPRWNIRLFVLARQRLRVWRADGGAAAVATMTAGPAVADASVRRLAVFVPTLSGGGAERAMLNLARAFVESGHSVDLILLRAAGAYCEALPSGVRLIVLDAQRTWSAVLRLARYLRREPPDRLFAAMEGANVVALCARLLARRRVPIVCGIHITVSKMVALERSWRTSAYLVLSRLLYPLADAIVAVSEGVAADAQAVLRLRPEQVSVIANPVLTPELTARAAEPVDHLWFAQGAPPVILACGRLNAQKDYPTLLRAFASVRPRRSARLLILGEGEEREALQQLADELGIAADVGLPGFVANPYAFMARCAVYALSSRFEGSPMVLVEALACGCRIVATDCPNGPAETLHGVPGTVLVPVGDVDALAGAIDAYLTSDELPGPRFLGRFSYHAAAAAYLRVT